LRSLRVLRLDHNRLAEYEIWTGLATGPVNLAELWIGANQWSCECRFVGQLLEWLPLRADVIHDLAAVHCQYNETYALPLAPVTTAAITEDIEAARANISAACSHYAKRESIITASSSSSII